MSQDQIAQALNEIAAHEPSINTALLLEVAQHVETHPEQLDMYTWGKESGEVVGSASLMGETIEIFSNRFTVGCMACRAVLLSGGDMDGNNAAQAQRVCGLTFEQAQRLFYVENWPEPFKGNFEEHDEDIEGRGWITAERIRHFIGTGL